ncbi:uncharacterized protein LOC132271745 [Cornus florida]|uniref:uncharacterized protein LOC132271745 n=1 Tax=Cornus florida TaxID=4283 RepID=UPI00289D56AF|nr:uncharacterized protein LOC132271745 [Cornus florida]
MAKTPVRFKRVAAAFHEVAPARLCESSGSEHSPESSMDLFNLVTSFIERDDREDRDIEEVNQEEEENGDESQSFCSNLETVDRLGGLLGCEDDEMKRNIRAQTEQAWPHVIGESSTSPGFKRRLMTRLRERGFDAGLCKSKWGKIGRYPSGQYEYIDVKVGETSRYIIEVSLAGEFEIARPTDRYTSLLNAFPQVFVGEVEELKQVVKTMCKAIKKSMKGMDLQIPPWRRYGYMQAKWFGYYKRTINEAPAKKVSENDLASKRLVGFSPLPVISYYCREDFARKNGSKVGLLAAAFSDTSMLS